MGRRRCPCTRLLAAYSPVIDDDRLVAGGQLHMDGRTVVLVASGKRQHIVLRYRVVDGKRYRRVATCRTHVGTVVLCTCICNVSIAPVHVAACSGWNADRRGGRHHLCSRQHTA